MGVVVESRVKYVIGVIDNGVGWSIGMVGLNIEFFLYLCIQEVANVLQSS